MILNLKNQEVEMTVVVTLVYAKYNQQERLVLWESLSGIAQSMHDPWIVGGDFNVVTSDEEKLGGLPVTIAETDDFNHCINLCNLEGPRFKESRIHDGMRELMMITYLKGWIQCCGMS